MELQHVNVKIYVDGELPVGLDKFIDVFHRWTAQQQFDEMLIDVADYRHVPAGPGIVLVGHEADYALDNANHRLGLLYNRKAPLGGTNADRLHQAFTAAASVCQKLEAEFAAESLKFSRQDFAIVINDRAAAPNTPQTLQQCRADLESFLAAFGRFTMEPEKEPRRRFGVEVHLAAPFDLEALAAATA